MQRCRYVTHSHILSDGVHSKKGNEVGNAGEQDGAVEPDRTVQQGGSGK